MGTKQVTPRREIDWSKPQFMISKSGTIVISNGNYTAGMFEGTLIHKETGKSESIGEFSKGWMKVAFEPLTEVTITIKND